MPKIDPRQRMLAGFLLANVALLVTAAALYSLRCGRRKLPSFSHFWIDGFSLRQCAWGEWHVDEVLQVIETVGCTALAVLASH